MSWPLGSNGSTAAASLLSRSKVRVGAKNLPLDRTWALLCRSVVEPAQVCVQHWEHPLNPLAIVQIMTTTFHATAGILNSFAQLTLKPQDSQEIRHSFEVRHCNLCKQRFWQCGCHIISSHSLSLYLDFTSRIYLVLKSYWGPGTLFLSWKWWARSCAIMTRATTWFFSCFYK